MRSFILIPRPAARLRSRCCVAGAGEWPVSSWAAPRDSQVMILSGPRTSTLVKVVSDDGAFGIAEAYGSPAIGVRDQILELKPLLVGKDPLEIDALYTSMGEGGKSLSGTRTDGSAHSL